MAQIDLQHGKHEAPACILALHSFTVRGRRSTKDRRTHILSRSQLSLEVTSKQTSTTSVPRMNMRERCANWGLPAVSQMARAALLPPSRVTCRAYPGLSVSFCCLTA